MNYNKIFLATTVVVSSGIFIAAMVTEEYSKSEMYSRNVAQRRETNIILKILYDYNKTIQCIGAFGVVMSCWGILDRLLRQNNNAAII